MRLIDYPVIFLPFLPFLLFLLFLDKSGGGKGGIGIGIGDSILRYMWSTYSVV